MSKLGRRLVFVLLSLSLTLMGISLAVNATATDWKAKHKVQADEKARLNARLGILSGAIEAEEKELQLAQVLKASQDKSYGDRITQAKVRVQNTEGLLKKTHVDYQASQEKQTENLKMQEKLSNDLKNLRAQIAAYEKQKAEFDGQNQELTDLVSQLDREVEELVRTQQLMESKTDK